MKRIALIQPSLISFFLFLVVSCDLNANTKQVLIDAETLRKERPDSSLFLLESILFPEKIALSYFYSGRVHFQQEKVQPAINDLFVAKRFAEQVKDNELKMSEILKNIGLTYREIGNFANAKKYLKKSIEFNYIPLKFLFPNYRELANTYVMMEQADSALHFLKKIETVVDSSYDVDNKYGYFYLLYKIGKKEKNFQSALDNYEKAFYWSDSINRSNKRDSQLEIQEKYAKFQLLSENNEAWVYPQQLTFLVIGILVAAILFVWFLVRNIEQKKKEIFRILLQAEETKKILDNLLSKKEFGRNDRLKKQLIEQLDLAKNLAYLNKVQPEKAKAMIEDYKELFDNDLNQALNWNHLYLIINEVYNDFADKITQFHPNLQEREKQLCCLMRSAFKAEEITYIMGYKHRESTDSMKYNLRNKFGFDSMKNFKNYLENL